MSQLEVMHSSFVSRFNNVAEFRHSVIFMLVAGFGLMFLAMPIDAYAQITGALPWEGPICAIAKSLSGPVARSATVIAVVGTGLMLAFGEVGGPFLTGLRILFGLSLALAASSWIPIMFPGSASSLTGCLA